MFEVKNTFLKLKKLFYAECIIYEKNTKQKAKRTKTKIKQKQKKDENNNNNKKGQIRKKITQETTAYLLVKSITINASKV